MATPEAEETVATPQTTPEAVVAEVVKTAEGGEKEAPKAAEEPTKVEEPAPVAEETTTAPQTESTEESTESTETPVEEPAAPFKEESNLVADLNPEQKKALEEFKARIVKAIADNEFKKPKKVVEPPPVVETPKEAETPAAEAPATETAVATETPAAETPAAETPAVETPPGETKATETPVAEPPVTEAPAVETKEVETPAPETPATETPAVEAKETPAAESETVAAATTEEAPAAPIEETTPAVGTKDEAAPAAAVVEEEEPEDLTPAEDVSLWGVPLLHTKGDLRTDVILLKFLRARDFNVALAFEQLKKTIIWRKTFKADTILEEDFGHDFDEIAYDYGKDKDGHPVCYNFYAPFQDKELYAKAFGDSTKLANFIRWRIQVLEKQITSLSFTPEGPSSVVQILDLKNIPGVGKKEVRNAYNQAVNILQDNYPELIVKMVFINVPWYFSAVYAFVSPFVSARTKSKFSRYTPARTSEGLLKIIPAHNIPVAHGGLSKPNDPDFDGVDAPAKELVVKASDKTTIEIPATEAGGILVWELTVFGYDVSYGAEYVPSAEGAYTTIIEKPKKLASTTEEPLRSSFKISEAGTVVISIDNAARKKKTAVYRYTIKTSTAAEPIKTTTAAEPAPTAEPEVAAA